MRKLNELGGIVANSAEDFWRLNYFNPLSWAGFAVMFVCVLLYAIFWEFTLKKVYKKLKSWAFMNSKKADAQWTRDCFRNLNGHFYSGDRNKKFREKHIRMVVAHRTKLIKKASKDGKGKR